MKAPGHGLLLETQDLCPHLRHQVGDVGQGVLVELAARHLQVETIAHRLDVVGRTHPEQARVLEGVRAGGMGNDSLPAFDLARLDDGCAGAVGVDQAVPVVGV